MLKGGERLLAFDHAVEHGPDDYFGVDISPERIGKIARLMDGIICHIGIAREVRAKNVIVKLSAHHGMMKQMSQHLVTSVREASDVADAVAVTLYTGTPDDGRMLDMVRQVKDEAHEYGLPLLVFAYPRGKLKHDRKAVLYASRMAQEIGADFVKTYYLGRQSAKEVVDYSFRPVYFGGGDRKPLKKVLDEVRHAASIGAGVAIGRNLWKRANAEEVAKMIMEA